ncbi:Gfo/Idh/MocA family oxidoreductase [Streptomyces sp. HNM0574]|uniref:Gfo/Idh/MocA family protein n=1 Tax=Streptomyces sp. HNM0574 TaxID=2714954 RepID=UPI00146B3BFB|nr:Gfo/Idh/MocA family oxidoreductase [Streptomyces sp. HNM0574]NLU70203.1 Gfo/Idh/MocA family oxidoreductase [Streptomyces sp. HNM0574]
MTGAGRPVRYGLLGTGYWAEHTHGAALHAHPDVELVGVWGRRPEAAEPLAARLGTRAYPSPDALFADCDAVAIAVPPDVQAPLAVRAAEAGCHLLLEKPVATTEDGARAVAEAVERTGVSAVVFFTLHFTRATGAWLAEATSRAATDGWTVGRAEWLSPVFAGSDSPYAASAWRRERGALWDIGPHALSVLMPVLGDVGSVRAVRGSGDTVHLILRHTNGTSSSAVLSHSVPAPGAGVSAEFRGAAGTATLPERGEQPADAFTRALNALAESVRTGVPHRCDVRFAQRVTEVLARAEADLD